MMLPTFLLPFSLGYKEYLDASLHARPVCNLLQFCLSIDYGRETKGSSQMLLLAQLLFVAISKIRSLASSTPAFSPVMTIASPLL